MSNWTHVNFIAEVLTSSCNSRTVLKEQIEEEIGAPFSEFITGSEDNAEVVVYVPIHDDGAELHANTTIHFWSRAYICCFGHLRDRKKGETEIEIERFINYLKRHFRGIRNITYCVYGDGEELNYYKSKEEK